MDKIKIVDQLKSIVASRVEETQKEIDSINFSKDNETKSSAGDKYETGMAMLQQEEQKAHAQMAKAQDFKRVLAMLEPNEANTSVQLGSLVQTNSGLYFIALAFGKVIVDDQDVYAISLVSPIGQLLKNQKVGFKTTFQGKSLEILSIS
jgi:transcription elongation GreA/GreB family factor|tara:strand:+ start:4462 stop:4908 length:447 start_codon:yes stop_codon:yes gene_type:complete